MFWDRIWQDYRAREVVFEVKNFMEPKNDDFSKVLAYLGAPQHGAVGFLVTRSKKVEVAAHIWARVRATRPKDGSNKLVLVLPSALLADLLRSIWLGRQDRIDSTMDNWLSEVLRRHLV